MEIHSLNATFGRLEQQELHLHPGLNLICAPNESGKSTWSAFIRTMLYGFLSRERSPLADKKRYVPWSGAAMQGRMERVPCKLNNERNEKHQTGALKSATKLGKAGLSQLPAELSIKSF